VNEPQLTLFETARAELRASGVDLAMRPGLWGVNYRGASDATAYVTDDLADAIEHGRVMAASILVRFVERGQAAQRAVDAAIDAATPARRRQRRRKKMTPKAYNRRMRLAQLRRMRARAIRHQKEKE
jgi:hypothetical protein